MNRDKISLDPTQTDVVRKFIEASDALGPPGSAVVNAYWDTIRFVVPEPWRARAGGLHPMSREYFDLQDQLYVAMRGLPYSDGSSEFTEIDKEGAINSRLAYPNRTPAQLNTYMRAHAKFADQFDSGEVCDVLEVGSGWGFSTEYLARLGHRVTAVDINPDFVKVASIRSDRDRLGIDYRLGSFEELPLGSEEAFDVIYCFEAFHHSRDFRGTLSRLVSRLRPKGQFILFGEPFIEPEMWPSWGLRLDPLSVYCIAKFGWWESGWTRAFMASVFRSCGLASTFVDEHSDLERYMIGRPSSSYDVHQLTYRTGSDGWLQDRHYLISSGRSRLEFYRPLRQVTLSIESFAPFKLSTRFESRALAEPVQVDIVPGENAVKLPLSSPQSGIWGIDVFTQTWNPHHVLGNGADQELSFHLRSVQEALSDAG